MITFGSVFLSISSVWALSPNPGLLLTSSSTTNVSNVSVLDTVTSPWHTSNGLETPPNLKNTTRPSTPTVARPLTWRCNFDLGSDPYAASCADAARELAFTPPGSNDSQQFEWRRRDGPVVQGIPLPQGVLSSDGHCRINVRMRPWSHSSLAQASQSQVRAGASAVIRNCMGNPARPIGGTASDISDDGLLNVEVWIPAAEDVFEGTCYGRMHPNAEASCKWVLDHMHADNLVAYVFGPGSDPDAEVHLPYRIESPDGRCAITIRTAGLSDSSHWFDLWEAAVGLTSVCARRGMQGRDIRLGWEEHLAVFLTDPSVDDVNVS